MTERISLLAWVSLWSALLCAGCSGREAATNAPAAAAAPAATDAPTVLLVTIDTLRADRVGCYGRGDAGTPVLDALAAAGTRFDNAQTTAPLTVPAHASILTGRTLPAHGVLNNGTFALPEDVPTVAERFRTAGYATGAFISSPVLAARYGLARGFERYDDEIPLLTRREGVVSHFPERAGTATAARAAEWLSSQNGKPAFLWVHLWEPHVPYRPPEPFASRYASDRYQGEVAAADAAVGELLVRVKALGRARLLVAVAGDHGEGLGEHGEPTHGVYLYRATMHVPLIVSGSAFGVKAAAVTEPVSLADLAPTLLELASVPALPGADGMSLAAGVAGRGAWPTRAGVFAESHLPRLEFGWSGLRAMVTATRKLIDAPHPELFELADRDEAQDLARTAPRDVERARGALDELVRRAAAAAPAASAEKSASGAELESLRGLGYAATGRHVQAARLVDPRLADPKQRAAFLARYDKAEALVEEGRVEDAVPIMAALFKEDPGNLDLHLRYGQALIVARKLDEATAVFRKAVALDPGFAMAWYRLGQLLDNAHDTEGALAAYRRSIAADPLALDPRRALSGLLGDLQRYPEAIDVIEQAQKLAPGDRGLARDLERFQALSRR